MSCFLLGLGTCRPMTTPRPIFDREDHSEEDEVAWVSVGGVLAVVVETDWSSEAENPKNFQKKRL